MEIFIKLHQLFAILLFLFLAHATSYFHNHARRYFRYSLQSNSLMMGRASVVRAETKSKTDAAKSKKYAKYGIKIMMAVKSGGSNLETNKLLSQIINEAKSADVPKDLITRNIEKASSASIQNFKESSFELYGYGGAGIICNVLTDNENRASASIQAAARKFGLKIAGINSVLFSFNQKAKIEISSKILEDELLDLCLNRGINDYELFYYDGSHLGPSSPGKSVVLVDMNDMSILRDTLLEKKFQIETGLVFVPKDGFLKISREDLDQNLVGIKALEELQDVDSVDHNIDLISSSSQ